MEGGKDTSSCTGYLQSMACEPGATELCDRKAGYKKTQDGSSPDIPLAFLALSTLALLLLPQATFMYTSVNGHRAPLEVWQQRCIYCL